MSESHDTNSDCVLLDSSLEENGPQTTNTAGDYLEVIKETLCCPLCFEVVDAAAGLEAHFTLKHTELDCPFCGAVFDNESKLNLHIESTHYSELTDQTNTNIITAPEFECPVCSKISKDKDWMERHVDSHFNAAAEKNSAPQANSMGDEARTSNFDSVVMTDVADYQLALSVQEEETKHVTVVSKKTGDSGQNSIRAQLAERKMNEALKFKLSKENRENHDEELANNLDYESDTEYSAELEHEWLKQKYGMTDSSAQSAAQANLDRVYKSNKIDIVTYQSEKEAIERRIANVLDDQTTCTKGLADTLRMIPLSKTIARRIMCTSSCHYASGLIDSGYGCGYRNAQMLLSSIRADPSLCDVVFNGGNTNMPSIFKIQELIEAAWDKGFDLMGKNQLGGKLKNTAKWIGASDLAAMFLSLKIKVELVDIQQPKSGNTSVSSILFNFVRDYFERETISGRFVHPIYLQHQGHSRTIAGIEFNKNDRDISLIVFDPGTRHLQIEQAVKSNNNFRLLNLFRRGPASFNKKKEYQLLLIRGGIESSEEYQRSKVLKSTRL